MTDRSFYLWPTALAAVLLSACGGGGSGDSPEPPVVPPVSDASKFTEKATWTFELPAAGASLCYDFNAKAQVPGCSGNAWDIQVKSGGRTAELLTNSGPNGSGAGGAFGSPFTHTWAELQTWKSALTDPKGSAIPANLYFPDAAKNVFTGGNMIQSSAFEYGLGGDSDHLLYPNYRVFLVTTQNTLADAVGTAAAPVYALQLLGYYGGAGGTASGHPTFRWLDRTSQQIRTATVDASAGWVYYNLTTAATVPASGDWHVAFNRYTIKLNGGTSGSGKVGGFVGATPAGFYGPDGTTPVVAKFKSAVPADTLADLTSVLATPANAGAWVKDSVSSQLSPAYTGTYPEPLDYGWFSYYPTDAGALAAGLAGQHQLKANPERATLVRSGEGNSYARLHLTRIAYAPVAAGAKPYTGTQTWTLEMDIQPPAP